MDTSFAAAARQPGQLIRIDEAIRHERNAVAAACLSAERASLLARHGFQADAEAALADLRRQHDGRAHPVVTPWINLADAIVSRRTHGAAHAILKARRAHALAIGGARQSIRALVAAWLAHFLWNAQEVEAAVGHVREALDLSQADEHKTRVRACLVAAEIHALSGRPDRAERWFADARAHAFAANDDASKSALSFNQSVVARMLLRQAKFSRSAPHADSHLAELHRTVSANVDAALGVHGDVLSQFEQADLLSLLDRPHEALRLYERQSKTSNHALMHHEWPVSLAHEAWCLARVGRHGEAKAVARLVEQCSDRASQLDDAAMLHSLLAAVWRETGEPDAGDAHAEAASEGWKRYAEYQSRCAALAETIVEGA